MSHPPLLSLSTWGPGPWAFPLSLQATLSKLILLQSQFYTVQKILVNYINCSELSPNLFLTGVPSRLLRSLGLHGDRPKGNQPWIFTGRTDAEFEPPILWPPDVKSQLIGKDPDAGKGWKWVEKGTTEDEMVGWHHRLNVRESEQTLGDGGGQGSLVCCSPWGHKELDTT